MEVSFGQIYTEVGASFPFSYRMQVWLSKRISRLAAPGPKFVTKYGADFALIVRINAKTRQAGNVIRGPAVFRKTRDVEYVVTLPYDTIIREKDGGRAAMRFLLDGVRDVFAAAQIVAAGMEAKREALIEHICTTPAMLEEPWPSRVAGRRTKSAGPSPTKKTAKKRRTKLASSSSSASNTRLSSADLVDGPKKRRPRGSPAVPERKAATPGSARRPRERR